MRVAAGTYFDDEPLLSHLFEDCVCLAEFDIEEFIYLWARDFAVFLKLVDDGLLTGGNLFLWEIQVRQDDSEGSGYGVEGGLDGACLVGTENSAYADSVGFNQLHSVE